MAGVLQNVGKLAKSLETFIDSEQNSSPEIDQNQYSENCQQSDHLENNQNQAYSFERDQNQSSNNFHFTFSTNIKENSVIPSENFAFDSNSDGIDECYIRNEDISPSVLKALDDILNKYKNKIFLGDINSWQSGLIPKLHGDCLQAYSEECNRCIKEAAQIIAEETEKEKQKAIQDALEKMKIEYDQQIKLMQIQFQKQLEDEIAATEDRVQQEVEYEMEKEKKLCEEKIKERLKEAAEQFKIHLKDATKEAQEQEIKMGRNKCKQMKSGFDEKFREIKRMAEEDKQKCLAEMEEKLMKERENAIQTLKKEEERSLNIQIKRQREDFENLINNFENKSKELENQINQLSQQLNEANVQKSDANLQLSNLKAQLQQFILLANKSETENPKINCPQN